MSEINWTHPRVCPICKKEFYPAPQHVYKKGNGVLICTWGCLCEYRRQVEAKAKARKAKKERANDETYI